MEDNTEHLVAKEPKQAIAKITAQKIHQITKPPHPGNKKAVLANLRHGVGKKPGEDPKLWGVLFSELPESMMGTHHAPSYAEWAIYTSLTLFAVHQQGKDPTTQPMHQQGCTLGAAVAKLVKSEDDRPRVAKRFSAMATATSMDELSHHLRGIVQLLRAESIPLDYTKLALDLFWYQHTDARASVRLSWGQDFYRRKQAETNDNVRKENDVHE